MIPLTGLGVVLAVLAATAIVALPRRWALIPLLVGVCYMTLSQGIMIGPFHFFTIRLLILAGFLRVLFRRELRDFHSTGLDRLIGAWAVWALLSSVFHQNVMEAFTFRLGLVFSTCGVYVLLRSQLRTLEDVERLCCMVALILVPVSLEMLTEQITGRNQFSVFGGVHEIAMVREGHIRSQGPFAHPILAGTVGAVSIPLMIGIWTKYRRIAIVGLLASMLMVITSRSSGPLMSAIMAMLAVGCWGLRRSMRAIQWAALTVYVFLDLVMKAPAYYLLARIDLSGGSTGWHRAALIESGIKHLREWWLGGTDYTRHWMPTGVSWNPNHTDITNHYLQLGVVGGLPLMLLFIAALVAGFRYVGLAQIDEHRPIDQRFLFWALGSSLFAHAATCVSVSYFDQSYVFVYLSLAAISASYAFLGKGVQLPEANRTKVPKPRPFLARSR